MPTSQCIIVYIHFIFRVHLFGLVIGKLYSTGEEESFEHSDFVKTWNLGTIIVV